MYAIKSWPSYLAIQLVQLGMPFIVQEVAIPDPDNEQMPYHTFVSGEDKETSTVTLGSEHVSHDIEQALLVQVQIHAKCHTNASAAQTVIVNQA